MYSLEHPHDPLAGLSGVLYRLAYFGKLEETSMKRETLILNSDGYSEYWCRDECLLGQDLDVRLDFVYDWDNTRYGNGVCVSIERAIAVADHQKTYLPTGAYWPHTEHKEVDVFELLDRDTLYALEAEIAEEIRRETRKQELQVA
jgi:hypothetical protein